MKKVMTMIAVVAVAGSAMAGLTEFNWTGGSAGGAVAGDSVATFMAADITYAGEATIDISALTLIDTQAAVVAPPFAGGTWGTLAISDATSDRVGQEVIALVGTSFNVGDTVNVSVVAGPLAELDTSPPGTPQIFNAGATTIGVTVVPEPATLGLMGIAGLGMFLARRKVRS